MAEEKIIDNRKSNVTTLRFAVAPLETDSADELKYGAVTEMQNNLITAGYQPTINRASQYASGVQVEEYAAKNGGTLNVTVCGLTAEDEELFTGSAYDADSSVITSNKDDIIPDLMAIWSTKRSDGTINLYKAPKVKFASQGETVNTTDENGITYQATSLQGNYRPLLKTGDDIFSIKGVNLKSEEGKALEEAWFATALGGLPAAAYPAVIAAKQKTAVAQVPPVADPSTESKSK